MEGGGGGGEEGNRKHQVHCIYLYESNNNSGVGWWCTKVCSLCSESKDHIWRSYNSVCCSTNGFWICKYIHRMFLFWSVRVCTFPVVGSCGVEAVEQVVVVVFGDVHAASTVLYHTLHLAARVM